LYPCFVMALWVGSVSDDNQPIKVICVDPSPFCSESSTGIQGVGLGEDGDL
jgi:hypothetical protein